MRLAVEVRGLLVLRLRRLRRSLQVVFVANYISIVLGLEALIWRRIRKADDVGLGVRRVTARREMQPVGMPATDV